MAEAVNPSAPSPSSSPAPRAARILVIDWLRGVAVVLMMLWHSFDGWLAPYYRTGAAFDVIRLLSGLPARLFIFLVGVSAAVVYEKQVAVGWSRQAIRAHTAKRGLQVIALAYLFRLQEHFLSGFYGGWRALFRIDVLNCIGASMLVLALLTTPRDGRPRILAALVAAAVFLGLGPIIGPAHFPSWLPRPLTSYIGGQRPMSWFPIFPWAAWALLGLAVGHIWLRYGRDRRRQGLCFLITGALGALSTGTVILIRKIDPEVIRYPNEVVQQMGPGAFFYRLGLIGILALLGWVVTSLARNRYSPIRQLGQTSLLIYWIHVDLCYGGISRPWRRQLTFGQTTLAFLGLALAMFVVSVVKTRYGRRAAAWVVVRFKRSA